MKTKSILFYMLFILFLLNINIYSQSSGQYDSLFEQFVSLHADSNRTADVAGFTLKRDVGIFRFEKGKFYAANVINDKVCAVIFSGTGTFLFSPPNNVEQDQLNRFFGSKNLKEKFHLAAFIFADSTFKQLSSEFNFHKEKVPGEIDKYLNDGLSYLTAPEEKYADVSFMETFLEKVNNDLFLAYFKDSNDNGMIFRLDPFEDEEITLSRENKTPRVNFSNTLSIIKNNPLHMSYSEVICSFRKESEEPANYSINYIKNDELKLNKYTIDAIIGERGSFNAKANVSLTPQFSGHNWINFSLYTGLTVDSVTGPGGKMEFSKGENSPVLWVKYPEAFVKDKAISMSIFYHGDLLLKIEEYSWLVIKSADAWYPRYGDRQKSDYEITFRYPSKYLLASIGNKVSSEDKDDITATKWVTDSPIRNASFNIGFFDDLNFPGNGIPDVDVYIGAEGHGNSTEDKAKDVGADIVNSLLFFSKIYGPLGFKTLYATEIPQAHGEAFPGLVHLDWSTFQNTGYRGYDEVFRAHEVAHQWWGIGVDFATYHDQWLSEGFAEYSGLWYMQTVLNDNDKFFKILDNMKDDILSARKYLFEKGQEPGPVYLGYRNNTNETKGDYNRVVYEKGAWILHMLRLMTIDLKSMKEDTFKKILSDFYRTYKGSKASTVDFQKIVERDLKKI